MNKILTFLLILILTKISSQDLTVTLSPKHKFPSNSSVPKFLYGNDKEFYFWRSESSGGLFSKSASKFFLEKYNEKFDQVASKEIAVSKEDVYYEGSAYINNQIALLISEKDKDRDLISYKVIPISLEGKASKPITMAKFKFERNRDIPNTSWVMTKDSSRILFLAESDNDSKKENYELHVVSINSNLNKSWDKSLKFSKTESQVDLLSKLINSNGETYLLYKIYNEKKREKKDDKAAYKLQLMHIKNDSSEVKKYELNIANKFIKSANLKLRNNGEIYCIGLYSNTVDGPIHGVFFMKLVEDQVIVSKQREFNDSELEKLGRYKTDKDKSGKEGLNENFNFNSMEISDDGSAFVTVEPNYLIERSSGRYGGYSITYYSEDIIIIDINSSGDINRLSILPKFQSNTESSAFLSHKTFVYKDKVYLFYNEDEDNFKKPIGNRPKTTRSYSDFVSTLTTLDKNGNFDRKAIFNYDDSDSIFMPGSVGKISSNKILFIAVQRKLFKNLSTYIFGTIEIND